MPPYPSSALGPRPRAVLSDKDALEMAMRTASDHEDAARKRYFYERFKVHSEDFRDLVYAMVMDTHASADTQARIRKHISDAPNVGKDVTQKVCVVYREGIRRELEMPSEREAEAFAKLHRESRIGQMAMRWHRLAFLVGPPLVVPFVSRHGRICYETLLPHYYDIVQDPDDLMGPPLAASWHVHDTQRLPTDYSDKADLVVLDGESWRYYRKRSGRPELVDAQEHGVGEFPGQHLRLEDSFDGDWFSCSFNRRVLSGTVEAAFIWAVMSFVRKSQNKKLLTVIGNLDELAKGQKQDPEQPLTFETDAQDSVTAQTLDFNIPIDEFQKHYKFVKSEVVEALGVPDYGVSFDVSSTSESGSERAALLHQALTEVRNEHIPACREFEDGLMPKTIAVMRAARHELASQLPPPDEIRDRYTLHIPKLARSFMDPQQEREHKDWRLRHGMTSELQLYMEENPTLTQDQARARQAKHLDERAAYLHEVASRQISLDQSGLAVSAEQAQGQHGGQASGESRRANNPDTGDSSNERREQPAGE